MPTSLAIDQSLNGTAFCVLDLDTANILLSETFKQTADDGLGRLLNISRRMNEVIGQHNPQIVVMEDYSGGRNMNSMIPLIELGGHLKATLTALGYQTGREAILKGEKVLMVQAQSSMKKFMLGNGATQKDSGYLLAVYKRLGKEFTDDNQADAYMHAVMAGLVLRVVRKQIPIDNLPAHQQETLISRGQKKVKGLSLAKAMKLSDEEKWKLCGW